MRTIKPAQIAVFMALFGVALVLTVLTVRIFPGRLPLGDFRGVAMVLAALLLLFAYSAIVYRIVLAAFPLREGEIVEGSHQEFVYHVYVLFYLLVFYPVMRSGFTPAPLMRIVYLALGARLGSNTYSQGIIHDPPFVRTGANCVIGQSALLVPHVIEGRRLAHYPITLGDNVTIGAHAVVLSGVSIGDDAIVATGAVVPKGTRINPGEVWGGVPAKRLRGPLGNAASTQRPEAASADF